MGDQRWTTHYIWFFHKTMRKAKALGHGAAFQSTAFDQICTISVVCMILLHTNTATTSW